MQYLKMIAVCLLIWYLVFFMFYKFVFAEDINMSDNKAVQCILGEAENQGYNGM